VARSTPESLLVSEMLNQQDAQAHLQYGVVSEHMHGYRSEFDWLTDFGTRYGRCPTKDEFKSQFEDFPISADQDDVRWPATEVIRAYSARRLSRALLKASHDLKAGEVEAAFTHFKDLTAHTVAEKPGNLLLDPGFLDDYDSPEDRIAVPWETPQRLTDGIGRGELWFIAARPSQGKSQTLMEIAVDAAMRGQTVIFYSLEMTKRQMQHRVHTNIAHKLGQVVSHHELKTKHFDKLEYKRLLDRISIEVPGTIHIHTPADGPTTPGLIGARSSDYDLSIVDYVGLMRDDTGMPAIRDWRVQAEISNALKSNALSHDARIVAASQINREGISNRGRPPKLEHLSGSDALGQDADVVMTMARYASTVSMFSMEKNRHGASKVYFWTKFDADRGEYTEIDVEQARDLRDNDSDWSD
jgi:hypothetical protein